VAEKRQQKVKNGWNQAGGKEVGHVEGCACVILVLCFAGDSSKIIGFIDEHGGVRRRWLSQCQLTVQTCSGWSCHNKWFQTEFEPNQTDINGLYWFWFWFWNFQLKPNSLVSGLGKYGPNQTKPNFPNTNIAPLGLHGMVMCWHWQEWYVIKFFFLSQLKVLFCLGSPYHCHTLLSKYNTLHNNGSPHNTWSNNNSLCDTWCDNDMAQLIWTHGTMYGTRMRDNTTRDGTRDGMRTTSYTA